MIRFGPDVCTSLDAALRREWLETNGLGGFASSTIVGFDTRRYHGLLTAATQPPAGRTLLLAKLEETLVIGDQRHELSSNRYPGVVYPEGYRLQVGFRLDPFPVFTWEVEGWRLEKTVFMIQGENSTVVLYQLTPTPDSRPARVLLPAERCALELRPLVAFRDTHATTHENDAIRGDFQSEPGLITLLGYDGLPALHLAHDADGVTPVGDWYRNFEYDVERERGLDWREDLFCPCTLTFDLTRRDTAAVIASTERRAAARASEYRHEERDRRHAIEAAAPAADGPSHALNAAAHAFPVRHSGETMVIAGYHWFGEWGRDTMIALPGLTLVTGRRDVAKSVLQRAARQVDRGMLPNRLLDDGTPEFNSVDAGLWLFDAVRAYLDYTGDEAFVRSAVYPVLNDIVEWHVRGTRHGIHLDEDGLVAAGEAGVQLTWMDARVGDWVVTPRRGKPVEVQALWYNALCIVADLAVRFGDRDLAQRHIGMAEQARTSFNRAFWNASAGCLYDVVGDEGTDASIRPNQVLAVSLTHSMLPRTKAKRLVDVVRRVLLTPFGLRTLSPMDPAYRGHCAGDMGSRDAAYHQGTAWPWLLGPFVTAWVKASGGTAKSRAQAGEWLESLLERMRDAGVGQIGEIFEGDPPHRPAGCIAQAWSVAELLRARTEDVLGIRPGRAAVSRGASAAVGAGAPRQAALAVKAPARRAATRRPTKT